jgi:hypothetical protein
VTIESRPYIPVLSALPARNACSDLYSQGAFPTRRPRNGPYSAQSTLLKPRMRLQPRLLVQSQLTALHSTANSEARQQQSTMPVKHPLGTLSWLCCALVKHQTSAPGKRVAILDVCRDNARMRFKKVFNEHSTVCELLLADLIISIQRLWIQRIYTVLGVSGSLNDCECPALWTSSKILQSIAVIRGTSLLYWAPWLARR